jgi:hypothetical protein
MLTKKRVLMWDKISAPKRVSMWKEIQEYIKKSINVERNPSIYQKLGRSIVIYGNHGVALRSRGIYGNHGVSLRWDKAVEAKWVSARCVGDDGERDHSLT